MASEKFEEIYAELKETFGDKKLLSIKDISPYVGKSEAALTKLKNRGRFPLSIIQIGGRFYVNIHDLADLLAGKSYTTVPEHKSDTNEAPVRSLESIKADKGKTVDATRQPFKFGQRK